MKKYLAIFFPLWGIDLVRRGQLTIKATAPILLITTHLNKQVVTRRCELAKAAGISLGMDLASAQARLTEALVLEFNPELERIALENISRWAYRFSPFVAPDFPPEHASTLFDPRWNGINLDITGNERLFDGDRGLVGKIAEGLAALSIHARLAIAPSLGAAWALSRYSEKKFQRADITSLRKDLALLPVSALRLSPQTVEGLKELNVKRIEHLFQLPRSSLLSRFGAEILKRLDQALAVEDEPLDSEVFTPTIKTEHVFDGPLLEFEALVVSTKGLLAQLLEKLSQAETKLQKLTLQIKKVETPLLEKEFLYSVSSLNERHIWSLIYPQLEKLEFGFGIESITLIASLTTEITATQTAHLPDEAANETLAADFGELLDSLKMHLGEENILQLQTRESHIPEEAFKFVPFNTADKSSLAKSVLVDAERPSVLFGCPRPVRALSMLPDGPPFWIKWKGETYRIENGIGPERIAPQWWGRDESLCSTRDYFKVQLPSGVWLWLFREAEHSRWFLHGIWA